MARTDRSSVHLTRIYTRTGDDGTTALGDMSRVPKTSMRVAAYGDVDEANAAIGVAIVLGGLPPEVAELLTRVQNDLFDVGADLCTPRQAEEPDWRIRITPDYVERLEQACDHYNHRLAKLDSFVLPGGSTGSALLHTARTVTRRAERLTWALHAGEPDATGFLPSAYLNRLSDLLFILARFANLDNGGDVLWKPGGGRPAAGSERPEPSDGPPAS
ncbi:MAG TPA: cob(I)yrinic acid a,c-diamide adenosyltransferase [Mycobacteriales bacterium]|nr:cob(I)yrinic acid a,c-diamide adenosyltransferase [Mycobacteriales bacterium]